VVRKSNLTVLKIVDCHYDFLLLIRKLAAMISKPALLLSNEPSLQMVEVSAIKFRPHPVAFIWLCPLRQ